MHFESFYGADFENLYGVIQKYLTKHNLTPEAACLAVAGPVSNGKAYLSNIGWHLSEEKLTELFSLQSVKLVNDFAALARSVTTLAEKDLCTIKPGKAKDGGAIAIMGPGTGFGSAILVPNKTGHTIVPTESGHISFMPEGKLEMDVWTMLNDTLDRVKVETLLSGSGISRIYKALCQINDKAPASIEPSVISEMALTGEDPLCLETLNIFCAILGSIAGDLALAQGATGGIYLGGGILPKIEPILKKSVFLKRFCNKPPVSDLLNDIPIQLISSHDAALFGAGLIFQETHS